MLTEPWPNMERDFAVEKDFDIFAGPEMFKECIGFYLNNPKKREEIAENGYQTVQKFSRDNWAKKLIEIIKEI